jgi:cell shape-determining protein MreD
MVALVGSYVRFCFLLGLFFDMLLQIHGALLCYNTGYFQNTTFSQTRLETTYRSLLAVIAETPDRFHKIMYELYLKSR